MIKAVIFDMYETLITLFDSPLYFGTQMAADAGISEEKFQKIWRTEEKNRTIGKITLEELLEKVLRENNCFSEEKMNTILKKRIHCKEEAFEHLHIEIIPMLKALKEKGILIGLISNCFSEEAMVIKKSVLYPFFDAACLSFDEGIPKPDPAIFERCIEKLVSKQMSACMWEMVEVMNWRQRRHLECRRYKRCGILGMEQASPRKEKLGLSMLRNRWIYLKNAIQRSDSYGE